MSAAHLEQRRERINAAAIALLVLLCAGYVFPRWADPNQNSRLDMIFAVVEDQTFRIDRFVANTVDYAKVGDAYFSDKAPGAAFLGIPVYAALRPLLDSSAAASFTERLAAHPAFAGTLRATGSGVSDEKVRFAIVQIAVSLLVSALATAFLAAGIYLWSRRLTPHAPPRVIAALGYGLLTPAYAYSNALYGHQLAAALLFGAFLLVPERPAQVRAGRLLLIGALLGYSVVSEYPAALAVFVLATFAAFRLLRLGRPVQVAWIGLAGAAVAAGWLAYNTAVFGGPLELGYSHSELWVEQHETGFMSLTAPSWIALWGILGSRYRGLFFYAPWLLLSLPGLWIGLRRGMPRAALLASAGVVVVIVLFNASSAMWWGGYAVGPRYLLPMLPFLVLLAVPALDALCRTLAGRLLLLLAFAWSALLVWGVTLAEQAFPPDTLLDPLLQHALPNWQQGNIARNLGTILGLRGAASLLPLLALLLLFGAGWAALLRTRPRPTTAHTAPELPELAARQGQ